MSLPENTPHPMTERPDLPSLAWALLRIGAALSAVRRNAHPPEPGSRRATGLAAVERRE
jgi:hypothetical protein